MSNTRKTGKTSQELNVVWSSKDGPQVRPVKVVKASRVNALNRKADKAYKARNTGPGKVVRVSLSGLAMCFGDDPRYEVKVKREHGITMHYHIRPDSEAVAMLDALARSGAVHSSSSAYAYPSWTYTRSMEDIALEAMGSD